MQAVVAAHFSVDLGKKFDPGLVCLPSGEHHISYGNCNSRRNTEKLALRFQYSLVDQPHSSAWMTSTSKDGHTTKLIPS